MPVPPRTVLLPALLVLLSAPLTATTVRQFNLAEMTARAQRIYVGTVLTATEGTVAIGGGQLATVTYRLSVAEDLRGQSALVKDMRIAEIRMLGKQRSVRRGNLRSFFPVPDLPMLTVGQEYLLFTTAPGSAGLSTMVGLGQGSFTLYGKGDNRTAVNEVNNVGLFRDMVLPAPGIAAARASGRQASGPIPYAALRAQILNLLATR
jgi:hypothetical protein